MSYEFILKKIVPETPRPRNKYKLVIKYMHGDADAYTKKDWLFDDRNPKDMETLSKMIDVLRANFALDWNTRCGWEPEIYIQDEAVREQLCDMDMFPGDATCDGHRCAMFDTVTITYFNDDGTEFEVDVFTDSSKKVKLN